MRGLRPVRTPTVAHALLRAVCGQLIQAERARAIERSVIRGDHSDAAGYAAQRAPDCASLGRLAPVELRRSGLRNAPSRDARAALPLGRARSARGAAQRGGGRPSVARARLGPWSVGVVFLRGARPLRPRARRRPRAREAPSAMRRAVGRRRGETAELLRARTASGPGSRASTCSRRRSRPRSLPGTAAA